MCTITAFFDLISAAVEVAVVVAGDRRGTQMLRLRQSSLSGLLAFHMSRPIKSPYVLSMF